MTSPRRVMFLRFLPLLTIVAFFTGSAAVAGSSGVDTPRLCSLRALPPLACMSMARLPKQAAMQHDSDTVKIGPGERTFLEPNFPNPFKVATTIAYSLSQESQVELRVYDFDFVEVVTLVDAIQPAGRYRVLFDPAQLPLRAPSGMYFYELRTNLGIEQRRMIYMK